MICQIEEVTEDTLSGREIESVTVPTIVTVEERSQASKGKSDPTPILQGSFSPLPKGTSLASLKGFSTCRLIWRKWKATH